MKKLTISLMASALVMALAGRASASSIPLFDDFPTADATVAAPAGSTGVPGFGFGTLGAVGGIQGGAISFVLPTAALFTVTIDDCCIVGDIYQAIVDGSSLGFTSLVQLNGPTNSTGTFSVLLSAGTHTLDIDDPMLSYLGQSDPLGGGTVPNDGSFSPAGLEAIGSYVPTPEPGTIALLGLGLVGMGSAARRRFVK